jgi:hypothetical protein
MSDLSNYYVKNGDQIYFSVLRTFIQTNGQQFRSMLNLSNFAYNEYTLLNASSTPTLFFIVKLQAVNGQKTSFKYSQSTDPYIRLGDVIGLSQINPSNPKGQIYPSVVSSVNNLTNAASSIIIQDDSWIGGSDTDLYQVWIVSDSTNMGYYNSGCTGVGPNPSCNVDPTCGLRPPTNIPVVYGQSYVIQNYGGMVDQTWGGNNYNQWFLAITDNTENSTNINRFSDTNSKPSENIGQGAFVTFNQCNTVQLTCNNYFKYYNMNTLPLSPDADPVENKGTSWWVYTLILLGIISLIVIVIVIYIIERKK